MTDGPKIQEPWDWKAEALGFLHEAFGLFASHRLARGSELGRKLDRVRHALEHSPPLTAFVERREPTADDEQSAKLERAMAVIDWLIRDADGDACRLCDVSVGDIESEDDAHAQDCPLVAQGFIRPDGTRIT
jgi:hypothetical protein